MRHWTVSSSCADLTLSLRAAAAPGRVSKMGRCPLKLSFAKCSLDGCSRSGWVVHLDHQPGVPLVPKLDHNSLFWIMYIPEHALTLLIKGTRRDHPRHVGSRSPDTLSPLLRDFRIDLCAHHVGQGNLQAALEGPQTIHAADVDDQGVLGKLYFGHSVAPLCVLA